MKEITFRLRGVGDTNKMLTRLWDQSGCAYTILKGNTDHIWNYEYPGSHIKSIGRGNYTVTFDSEKDATMFLLKWL